jgi:TusA-related sulfurtransferase
MPIVKLGAAMRGLEAGGEIRIHADDRGFVPDVRAWCFKTGNELVSLEDGDPTDLVAVVRKAAP